jgi:hypothetical protein
MIIAAVCNKYFGGNIWRFPPKSLCEAARLSGISYLQFLSEQFASTGRCTIGNAADNVGIAWWGSCPFFSLHHSVFRQPLTRLIYRTKWTSCVASVITKSLSCRLLIVGLPEDIVYSQRCNKLDELLNAIEAAGTTIRNLTDVFQQTRKPWRRRTQLCIDCNGGPF